jgi:hypothetical protein
LAAFQIDHQLVLGWVLYRQVGGLPALEDAINVAGLCASPKEREHSPQFGNHLRFNLRAIAANISELLGSLDKPLLAELPFLVGC